MRSLLSILLLASSVAMAPSTAASASDPIEWLSTNHDFGAFTEDSEKITAEFRFVNHTSDDVAILQAAATCGCTVAKYDDQAIAPGDTAVIKVTYDPTGRPGRFSKQVYVRTSASPERYRLNIQGIVIGSPETIKGRYPVDMGALKLKNGAAMLSRISTGKPKMAYVDGYNLSSDTIRPSITYKPSFVDVSVTPAAVPPGDLVQLDIYYRGSDVGTYGIVNDSIVIESAPGQSYSLPLVAIVEEDFSSLTEQQKLNAPVATLEADRIDLGRIDRASKKTIKASIHLLNTGKSPLKIRRLYTQDTVVDVSMPDKDIKPGGNATITATFDPAIFNANDSTASSLSSGIINATAVLITNDPSHPTRQIRIVGTVSSE